MQLRGVEFFNFACFEQQFVGIRQGLNLLVGKNNAGKTALLKGLAALSAIPLQDWPRVSSETSTFIRELKAYARQEIPEPNYHVEILVDCEPDDTVPLQGSREDWKALVGQTPVMLAYRFWFLPQRSEDQVLFEYAELRIKGRPNLKILTSNKDGVFIRTYQFPAPGTAAAQEVSGNKISQSGKNVSAPDNESHWVPLPKTHYFDALAPFSMARYVSPHRVVTPLVDIQTAETLPENANNLSVFLQTLHGRNRRAFRQVEDLATSIFPEFSSVNPFTEQNRVTLTLTRRDLERDIPLTHCGTGVEQVLAIATFTVTAAPGAVLLIDEPHSFLHPAAERQLINFLRQDGIHRFVISTHSAIFINSMEADHIMNVEAPGKPYEQAQELPAISHVLLELGYRNSDVLFFDFLIFVEGRSDKAILPTLLAAAGIESAVVNRAGFPAMDGVPGDVRSLQLAVHRYEKLISALSRAKQPRIYLFDGDRSPEDTNQLSAMRDASGKQAVPVKFLPRTEIENYLLVASAIKPALEEEAKLAGVDIQITEDVVRAKINDLLQAEDANLFPRGKGNDPSKTVRGSVLLQRLYTSVHNLVYDKERSGGLIARHLTLQEQPALRELSHLLVDLFHQQ